MAYIVMAYIVMACTDCRNQFDKCGNLVVSHVLMACIVVGLYGYGLYSYGLRSTSAGWERARASTTPTCATCGRRTTRTADRRSH